MIAVEIRYDEGYLKLPINFFRLIVCERLVRQFVRARELVLVDRDVGPESLRSKNL